ncbi:MAG: hypothetical protein ACRCWJ_10615 [Casimicrobium sp.]
MATVNSTESTNRGIDTNTVNTDNMIRMQEAMSNNKMRADTSGMVTNSNNTASQATFDGVSETNKAQRQNSKAALSSS